jgi:mono/diheme cytochrome c family protein
MSEKEDYMRKIVLWLPVILITILITFVSLQTSNTLYAESNNSGKSDEKATSEQLGKGEQIFNSSCRVCHANGGNVINSSLPLRGSQKLADIKTFLSFIRNPRMPDGSRGAMPSFSESQISDNDAENLYAYFVSKNGMNLMNHSSDK